MRQPAGGLRAGVAGVGPPLATLLFVVLLAAQLAALLWRLLGSSEPQGIAPPPLAEATAPAVDLSAIVNAHLFGVAAAQNSGEAPLTAANLTLAGTLAGRDPEQGWAIIGASGQSARVYATGASLPGGPRLLAVYPDRVILDRNGVRESLVLPRLSGGAAGGAAQAYMPQTDAPAVSLADSVRQLVAENPAAAGELLRPQPVFAGGSLRGYRVYPGRNRAQFASLGLQPGDLVTAVNGSALDDPNRGPEILRSVGQGGAVTLTIDRNGQQQQLSVDPGAVVQQLQAPQQSPPENDEATE